MTPSAQTTRPRRPAAAPIADANDHDLLIRLDERTMKIDTCMRNHLRHHAAVAIGLVLALIGTGGSLLIVLLQGRG